MRFVLTILLLSVFAVGCQNQQAVNPFAAYGPQRLPPPPTQSYGQPATTAPYYQGAPSANAPVIQGGYQQGQPPAQFNPPASTYPTQQGQHGQWKGVEVPQPGTNGVVAASYTQEVQSNRGSAAPASAQTAPQSTSNQSNSLKLGGMRVNEISSDSPPAGIPQTNLAPQSTANPPAAFIPDSSAQPISASRIP